MVYSNYGVILPAAEIPEGTSVVKISGSTVYTLKHMVCIYNKDGSDQVITQKGCVYLISEKGDINVYPDTQAFIIPFEGMQSMWDMVDVLAEDGQ